MRHRLSCRQGVPRIENAKVARLLKYLEGFIDVWVINSFRL